MLDVVDCCLDYGLDWCDNDDNDIDMTSCNYYAESMGFSWLQRIKYPPFWYHSIDTIISNDIRLNHVVLLLLLTQESSSTIFIMSTFERELKYESLDQRPHKLLVKKLVP